MALSGTVSVNHVQLCLDEAALSRFDDEGPVSMMTPAGRMITQEVQLMPFNSLATETLIVVSTELAGGRPSANFYGEAPLMVLAVRGTPGSTLVLDRVGSVFDEPIPPEFAAQAFLTNPVPNYLCIREGSGLHRRANDLITGQVTKRARVEG